MTIQRRDRTRRLLLEPLEARDVPSVVSPHAALLRPMARAEVHRAAHHHAQAVRVHTTAAIAASSRVSAGAASSSVSPAGSDPEPIAVVVLGPMSPAIVTEVPVQISPPMTVTTPPIDIGPPVPTTAVVVSGNSSI
jgi:hypothetical protein